MEKQERILEINRRNDILLDLGNQKIKKEEELQKSKEEIEKYNKKQGNIEKELEILENKYDENEEKLKKESEEDKGIYDFWMDYSPTR